MRKGKGRGGKGKEGGKGKGRTTAIPNLLGPGSLYSMRSSIGKCRIISIFFRCSIQQ